jgi:hypothetical protein
MNFRMASGEMTQAEFVDFLAQAFECLASYTVDGSIHYICMDWHHIEEVVSAGKRIYARAAERLRFGSRNAGGMGSFYRSQLRPEQKPRNGALLWLAFEFDRVQNAPTVTDWVVHRRPFFSMIESLVGTGRAGETGVAMYP